MEDERICAALICGLDALYGRTIHSPGEWNIISDTLWYICGYPECDLIIVRVDTAVDLDSDGALLRVTLTGIRVGAAGFCEDELIFSVKRRFVSALPVEREGVYRGFVGREDISGCGDPGGVVCHINAYIAGEFINDIYRRC